MDVRMNAFRARTWVYEQLTPELTARIEALHRPSADGTPARFGSGQWTRFMDHVLGMLADAGVTRTQLEECLCAIPVFSEMLDAARLARDQGCELHVLSDANTIFIPVILRHHGLLEACASITSNPAEYEGERLRVEPHQPAATPHGCPFCPPNLCKGRQVNGLRRAAEARAATGARVRFFYVGDGGGDFCAATRLRSDDVLFARAGWRLHKKVEQSRDAAGRTTLGGTEQWPADVVAHVVPWETGADVFAYLQHELTASTSSTSTSTSTSESTATATAAQ